MVGPHLDWAPIRQPALHQLLPSQTKPNYPNYFSYFDLFHYLSLLEHVCIRSIYGVHVISNLTLCAQILKVAETPQLPDKILAKLRRNCLPPSEALSQKHLNEIIPVG